MHESNQITPLIVTFLGCKIIFRIDIDASGYGIWAILYQIQNEQEVVKANVSRH